MRHKNEEEFRCQHDEIEAFAKTSCVDKIALLQSETEEELDRFRRD